MLKIKIPLLVVALVGIYTLSACGTSPKRTPYAGPDQVGEIDTAKLIGNWRISVLNPAGEENASHVTQSFKPDGTWESLVIPPKEQTDELGSMQYKGQGLWQVNGDSVFSKVESIEETTGNQFGGLMEALMSIFMSKMSGSANVYEMSDSRIVLVYEKTGQATLLERI